MICRKRILRKLLPEGGGMFLVPVKCRGRIQDDGRCRECGGGYRQRSKKPVEAVR